MSVDDLALVYRLITGHTIIELHSMLIVYSKINKFKVLIYPISLIEMNCRQNSNVSRILVSNKIVDHPVVGASPVGAAPTTSSFSTSHLASVDEAKTTAWRDEKHLHFGI